jgi:hypothetical protein
VPRYYLANRIAPWEWTGLNWYQYRTRSGQLLQGGPAYRAAIDAGVFDIVVLQYGYNAALAHSLDNSLNHVGPYDQIAKIPYSDSFGRGDYVVWRRR